MSAQVRCATSSGSPTTASARPAIAGIRGVVRGGELRKPVERTGSDGRCDAVAEHELHVAGDLVGARRVEQSVQIVGVLVEQATWLA